MERGQKKYRKEITKSVTSATFLKQYTLLTAANKRLSRSDES
jgi:hypothetical protein